MQDTKVCDSVNYILPKGEHNWLRCLHIKSRMDRFPLLVAETFWVCSKSLTANGNTQFRQWLPITCDAYCMHWRYSDVHRYTNHRQKRNHRLHVEYIGGQYTRLILLTFFLPSVHLLADQPTQWKRQEKIYRKKISPQSHPTAGDDKILTNQQLTPRIIPHNYTHLVIIKNTLLFIGWVY